MCAGTVSAALIDRGTGMIYDTDIGVTWYDFTYQATGGWDDAMNWADALSLQDPSTGIIFSDWRLPSPLNFDGTGPEESNYPINTEFGHLYFDELGHVPSPPWGIEPTGPFQNFPGYCIYLNERYGSIDMDLAWAVNVNTGIQQVHGASANYGAFALREGDTGPSASVGSDYVANLILGNTFSFDYWWQMEQEPTGFNMDIFFLRDNSWHLLGGDINFDRSSSAWENISLVVPHELQGMQTQIRFSVYDLGEYTDPTVYLRNIASNGTAPVPEPATMLLLGTGLIGLAGFRKKFKK